MFFKKFITWIQGSSVVQQAEKAAMQEVSDAIQKALAVAIEKAPDMQEKLADAAQIMLSHALAGIATKSTTN